MKKRFIYSSLIIQFFLLLLIFEIGLKIPYGLSSKGSFYFPNGVRSSEIYYMVWLLNLLSLTSVILIMYPKKIIKIKIQSNKVNYLILDLMLLAFPLICLFLLFKKINLLEFVSKKQSITDIYTYVYLKGSFFSLLSAAYFLIRINSNLARSNIKHLFLFMCFLSSCIVVALTSFIFSQRAVILVLMLQILIVNFMFHKKISSGTILLFLSGLVFVLFISALRAKIETDVVSRLYEKIMQTRFFIDTFRQIEVMESKIDYNLFNFLFTNTYQDLIDNKALGKILGVDIFMMGNSGVTPGLIGELYLSFPIIVAFALTSLILLVACNVEYYIYKMAYLRIYKSIVLSTILSNFVIALNSSLGSALWQIILNISIFSMFFVIHIFGVQFLRLLKN